MQRKPPIDDKSLDAFILGAKDEKTKVQEQHSEQKPIPQEEIDINKLRRQTYYITELYIQAIEQMAFYEQIDKYKIVMNALEQYIPAKYVELAAQFLAASK